jgi:hypothetical protein
MPGGPAALDRDGDAQDVLTESARLGQLGTTLVARPGRVAGARTAVCAAAGCSSLRTLWQ